MSLKRKKPKSARSRGKRLNKLFSTRKSWNRRVYANVNSSIWRELKSKRTIWLRKIWGLTLRNASLKSRNKRIYWIKIWKSRSNSYWIGAYVLTWKGKKWCGTCTTRSNSLRITTSTCKKKRKNKRLQRRLKNSREWSKKLCNIGTRSTEVDRVI